MNNKAQIYTIHTFFTVLLLSVLLFNINIKKVEATEKKNGNDLINDVEIKDFGEHPIDELNQGMMARLYYTLILPNEYTISKGDTLDIDVPNEIQVIDNENVPVYADNRQVGEISKITTSSKHLTITFFEEITPQTEITIENIIFNINEKISIGNLTLNFGNNIQKNIEVLEATKGLGSLFLQESFNLKNRSLLTPNSWEIDAGFIGNYFYGENDIPTIRAKNPNFSGNISRYAAPYYFYGKDENDSYLEGFIARCIDMNHSISVMGNAQDSNMSNYIEEKAVENIVINTQISFMLAKEHGLIMDSKQGTQKPIQFTPESDPESYHQKAYLFASQMMGWIDAVKYSKLPTSRIDNFDYSDMTVYSKTHYEDDYEQTDINPYIEEIEMNTALYKTTDYMTQDLLNIELGETKTVIAIPEEQKKFKHWIDKENSENLELLDGISESDFESFESLTVTANQEFKKEKVKIAIRKGFYDSQEIQASAISENNNQYKQMLGMTADYEMTGVINLEMKPKVEVGNHEKTKITVTKIWEDNENQDGLRPMSIDVQLYANGEPLGDVVTLNEANDWHYIWKELDKSIDGEEIDYTVKELTEVPGYSVSIANDSIDKVIINSHEPELIDISGEKTWNDNENQAGIRPEVISVNLLGNGTLYETKKVSSADDWSYIFTNLPKYENGKEIIYTITENHVNGYSTEIKGTNLINNYTPEKTSATVTKEWRDNDDEEGARPESIYVQLYGNGQAIGEAVKLSKENSWTYTWSDLDLQQDDENIVYTVEEKDDLDNYYAVVDNVDQGNLTITNVYINVQPKTGSNNPSLPSTGEKINYLYILIGISVLCSLCYFTYVKKYK